MAKLKNVNELKFTKIMSEQEIIIRKSAELKQMAKTMFRFLTN